MRFERLGCFTYSHEENTHAYNLEDDVPQEVKQDRANQIMEIQSQISWELNQQKIGQVFKVVIDRKEGNYFVGRTEFDSPDVDNEVLIDVNLPENRGVLRSQSNRCRGFRLICRTGSRGSKTTKKRIESKKRLIAPG